MSSVARSIFTLDAPPVVDRTYDAIAVFAAAEKLLDMLAVISAVFVANAFCRRWTPDSAVSFAPSTLFWCAACFGLLFVYLLERHNGYQPWTSLLAIRETERILRVTLQAFLMAVVCAYLFAAQIPSTALIAILLLAPVFVILEKWESHRLLSRLRRNKRAVIVGTGNEARHIFTSLVRSPKFGVEPVAFVNQAGTSSLTTISELGYHHEHSVPVLSGPVYPELLRDMRANVLVIADPSLEHESIESLVSTATAAGATTMIVPGNFSSSGSWVEYAELDGITVAQISRPKTRMLYGFGKRVLDVVGATLLMLLFAPIAPLIAAAVKLSSSGPLLFRQERIGKQGRPFGIYKFRTMYIDAPEYEYSPTEGEDPRITPVGRFMRRTSLDELPQLINVLLGHMSLVGPRPEMPFIVESYTPLQRQRLAVKPGITGLWQISADRAFLIHENIGYDLYYVRHRSLWMDVAILLHTALRVAHGV